MTDNQRELFIMFLMCELGCLGKYLKNAKNPDLDIISSFIWMATSEGHDYWLCMDKLIYKELKYYMY